MAAVIGAFVKYIVSMIFLVIVAGFGIACGKKLHDRKKKKKEEENKA